jgi:hypothetical protein
MWNFVFHFKTRTQADGDNKPETVSGCMRIDCQGRYLGIRGRRYYEAGEYCIERNNSCASKDRLWGATCGIYR